jgi:hypothetical protein
VTGANLTQWLGPGHRREIRVRLDPRLSARPRAFGDFAPDTAAAGYEVVFIRNCLNLRRKIWPCLESVS